MKIHANSAVNNTAGQNKGLRMRELRAMRGPKTDIAEIPDMRASDYPEDPSERIIFEDMDLRDKEGHRQWLWNLHKGELVRRNNLLVFKNVSFTADEPQTKWGMRCFNTGPYVLKDCDFTEITQEHGAYVSNSSNVSATGCTFLRVGSQGLQFAHRSQPYQQYDADCMDYDRAPIHEFRDCHFIDCAQGGTRPSFNLTMFDPGDSENPATIRVEDCSFVSKWHTAGPKNNFSSGAFVFNCGQGGPENDDRNPIGSVTIKNSLFDFTSGDRPIGKIDGVSTVMIEDSCFIGRAHNMPFIDINRKQDWTVDGIYLKNCTARGNAQIRLWDGDDIIARVSLDTGPGRTVYINGEGAVFAR